MLFIKCLTATPGSVDHAKIAKLFDTLPVLDIKKSGALRIDASVTNSTNDDDDWIDATRIHTTCASYVSAEFKAVSLERLNLLPRLRPLIRYSGLVLPPFTEDLNKRS